MKQAPIRVRYFTQLTWLLLASYIIFFGILCVVELRKGFIDPAEMPEALHEVSLFLIGGLISLPLAMLLAWRLTRSLLRPLLEMVQTAEHIGGGDFSKRIQINRSYDELDQLASSFNTAFDRYEEAVEKLKHFSADAAHQLRTPLTSIRSTGEIALLKERCPAEYQESLQQILEDIHDLSVTIDQLLLLAQLETGTTQRDFEAIALEDSIARTSERFQPLLEQKNITLEIDTQSNSVITGAPALMDQVFANLMDNAIRATPENGTIWISLSKKNGTVLCEFEDNGPGIPDTIQQRIFERFQSDRTSDRTTSGLGLSIVQDIIQVHQGSISAGKGLKTSGALFTIQLPIHA